MLAAFQRKYPGIELSVSLGNTADVLQELLDYRIDVAVLAYTDPDERVLLIPHRRHPIVVFCRKDHRLARRRSIQLRDLEGERMIVREQGSTTRRAFTAALEAARCYAERRDGDRQPRRRARSRDPWHRHQLRVGRRVRRRPVAGAASTSRRARSTPMRSSAFWKSARTAASSRRSSMWCGGS